MLGGLNKKEVQASGKTLVLSSLKMLNLNKLWIWELSSLLLKKWKHKWMWTIALLSDNPYLALLEVQNATQWTPLLWKLLSKDLNRETRLEISFSQVLQLKVLFRRLVNPLQWQKFQWLKYSNKEYKIAALNSQLISLLSLFLRIHSLLHKINKLQIMYLKHLKA